MVATLVTMAADVSHQFVGAPYWSTSLLYAIVLGLVCWRWSASDGTLSIHSMATRIREKFYWDTGLTAGIIVFPAFGYLCGANSILVRWFAYVVTRPLGASFANSMYYPKTAHGLAIEQRPSGVVENEPDAVAAM
jgi:uncharacterized membrane-anchored protein